MLDTPGRIFPADHPLMPATADRGADIARAEARRPPFGGRCRLDRVDVHGESGRATRLVAVPIRDEAEGLGACLSALEEDLCASAPAAAVLVVNGSVDGSADVARAWARRSALPAIVCEVSLSPSAADVGHARRLALEIAASVAAPGAVLLSTDADTRVAPGWSAALAGPIRAGAGLAYGPIASGGDPSVPAAARRIARAEDHLAVAQAALWRTLVPGAPQAVGVRVGAANLAVSASAYRACGGLPPLPLHEDRALAARMIERGERIVAAPGARVATSMRLDGRVAGGMAATLAARAGGDDVLDGALLPTRSFVLRALAYRSDREDCRASAAALASRLGGPRCHSWRMAVEAVDPPSPLRLADALMESAKARAANAALSCARRLHPPSPAAVLKTMDTLDG